MTTTRRTILQSMLAAGAVLKATTSVAQSPGRGATAAPIARNLSYRRIATEEAWITREIADESMRLIASNPVDEPGFVSFGARYYARGADTPTVTTSGMAWEPAILFAQQILGMDRVLYAMDYPYQADASEVVAMDELALSDADKKKFFQTNAEALFAL